MATVEGRDPRRSQPLRQHHDGGVGGAEGQIGVLADELRRAPEIRPGEGLDAVALGG
jgi:hypothetical protein